MRDPTIRPTRRNVLALGVGAFVLAAVPLARSRRERLVRRRLPVMGTIAEIAVVDTDDSRTHAAIGAAFAALYEVDHRMSRFRSASDIGRANGRAGAGPVAIGDDTAAVIRAALRWAGATDGCFDPCVGRAMELWDPGRRTMPPAPERVERLAGRRLYRALDLDVRAGRPVVRLTEADAALDLGGIAKGFGVDRAAAALRDHGVRRGLVNVGGDLYALGTSQDGDPWQVGVRSPDDPARLIGRIAVEDAAVATSGDYESYFEHGGRRYHHLLDPRTAQPRASSAHSLTIVADTCMTADAAATAVFGAPEGDARRVLRAVAPEARIVRTVA